MSSNPPDLVGVYITDDRIQVLLGADSEPNKRKLNVSELHLEKFGPRDEVYKPFHFDDYPSVEATFDAALGWATRDSRQIRAIGVGCYGPFESLDPAQGKRYGRLQSTSHGRPLARRSIPDLVARGLHKVGHPRLLPYVETDVATAVIGEVYRRADGAPRGERSKLDDQIVVFIKASLGIGGAFLRARAPYRGRMHPEMGQLSVPRWIDYGLDRWQLEAGWRYPIARNPNSVEGLACVGAIEARFGVDFEQLVQKQDDEPVLIAARAREAWYLAQMAWSVTAIVSPHSIVFGGRIMRIPGMIQAIRETFAREYASRPFPSYSEMQRRDYLQDCISPYSDNFLRQPGILGAVCYAALSSQPDGIAEIAKPK